MLTENQKQILQKRKAVDFTYEYQGTVQLRCSLFYQERDARGCDEDSPESLPAGKVSMGKVSVSSLSRILTST